MLFDHMSFVEANNDLSLSDGLNIGVAAGFGTVSGIAKFGAWAGSSTGRKIIVKFIELGLGATEDILKQFIKIKEN